MIIEETSRCVYKMKNKLNYNMTKDEIRNTCKISEIFSYYTLPSERDYWAKANNLGVIIVKNAMTRNFYLKLRRLLYF